MWAHELPVLARSCKTNMLSGWACTFERASGGTRTAAWCGTTRSPRTRGIRRRAMSRPGWCTASAVPTGSTGRCWSGWWRASGEFRPRGMASRWSSARALATSRSRRCSSPGRRLWVVHVVEVSWERLGIAAAISARIAEKQLKAPHLAALLAMTMQRLERPGEAGLPRAVAGAGLATRGAGFGPGAALPSARSLGRARRGLLTASPSEIG